MPYLDKQNKHIRSQQVEKTESQKKLIYKLTGFFYFKLIVSISLILCILFIPKIILNQHHKLQNHPLKLQVNRGLQDSSTINQVRSLSTQQNWQLQKNIWLFNQPNDKMTPQEKDFEFMNLLNTKHFAELDHYTINTVNKDNYGQYLSQVVKNKIVYTMQQLQKNANNQNDQNVKKQFIENREAIRKRLIVYSLLLQKGGIFVDNKITVVERFSTWLENIMTLPYINVGDKIDSKIKPQCFGFFRKYYGSIRTNVNIKRQYEFEKKLVIFPSLEDEFLACSKGSEYLKQLIDAYIDIMTQRKQSYRWAIINKDEKMIGKTDSNAFYRDGHLLASHFVLQQRQQILDNRPQTSPYRKLAIDDFGLITMNTNLGPRKLQFYFADWNFERYFIYLSKLMIEELEHTAGKVRFLYLLRPNVIEKFIQQIKLPQDQMNFIVQGSFVHIYYLNHLIGQKNYGSFSTQNLSFNDTKRQFTFKNIQIRPSSINRTQNLNSKQWQSIPKKIFMIWDTGIRGNSSFIVELCAQNIIRSAQKSGFQVHIVTQYNVKQYLSHYSLSRIEYAMAHSTMEISKSTISDMWRLALIMEHGGIYVDSTTFTMEESYDWLLNITRIPSNFIWNRYGSQPDVLMFWNTYYRNQMNWWIDKNTKSTWHLSYESGFIAAVKGSELIKQWFDLFMDWICAPYQKIEEQIEEVKMTGKKWTSRDSKYLMVMDSIKHVVGRRQKLLQKQNNQQYKSSSDYYKVWSFPGQMVGQLKFRGESNFENEDYRYWHHSQNSIYRYEYPLSYVQSIDGETLYQAKFFSHGHPIDEMLMPFYHKNKRDFSPKKFEEIIHPESLLSLNLLSKYPQKTHYLLSYYENLSSMRIKQKGQNSLSF